MVRWGRDEESVIHSFKDMLDTYNKSIKTGMEPPELDTEKLRTLLVLSNTILLQLFEQQMTSLGYTTFHVAAGYDHCKTIRAILSALPKEICLKVLCLGTCTPVHVAAGKGHTESVKAFLNSDNLDAVQRLELLSTMDPDVYTALRFATAKGHIPTARAILDSLDADEQFQLLSAVDEHGGTIYHSISDWGSEENVVPLLMHLCIGLRVKLMNKCDINGNTALHYSSGVGNLSSVETIIYTLEPTNNKRDLHHILFKRDNNGKTALHIATLGGHTLILEALLLYLTAEKSFELMTQKDSNGNSAYSNASFRWDTRTMKVCLDSLTPRQVFQLISEHNFDGQTIFHRASEPEHVGMLRALLQRFPPKQRLQLLSIQDKRGATCLHLNMTEHKMETLLDSLEMKERLQLVCCVDHNSQTILHRASLKGDENVVKCILGALATSQDTLMVINKSDIRGETALQCALRHHFECTADYIRNVTLNAQAKVIDERNILIQQHQAMINDQELLLQTLKAEFQTLKKELEGSKPQKASIQCNIEFCPASETHQTAASQTLVNRDIDFIQSPTDPSTSVGRLQEDRSQRERGNIQQQTNTVDSASDTESSSSSSSDGSHLSDLDMPFHTSIVTVRKLTKRSAEGSVHSLYHLFAGILKDSVNKREGGLRMVTEIVNNNHLYHAIKAQCQEDLEKAEKKDLLLTESPCFVVTDSMPVYSKGELHMSTILPEINLSDKFRETYVYEHPSDSLLRIKITEPSSPADVDYGGDGAAFVKSDTSFYQEDRYKQIEEELTIEQGRQFHQIMTLYNESGSNVPNTRVSVLISVFKTWGQPGVRTIIHIIKGIITPKTDKAAFHRNVSDTYGWITTLHWLNSPQLLSHISTNADFPLQFYSLPLPPLTDEQPRLHSCSNALTQLKSVTAGEEVELHSRKKGQTYGSLDLKVKAFTKGSSWLSTSYKYEQQVNETDELSRSLIDQRSQIVLGAALQATANTSHHPATDDSHHPTCTLSDQDQHPEEPATISLHEVKSMLKKSSKKRLAVCQNVQTSFYAILAIGDAQNIPLPDWFEYQDALSSWRSRTVDIPISHQDNTAIVDRIRRYWNEERGKGREMAQHMIYASVCHNNSLVEFEKIGQELRISFNLNDKTASIAIKELQLDFNDPSSVTMGKLNKDLHLLDVHSHGTDTACLNHHLQNYPTYLQEFKEILEARPDLHCFEDISKLSAFRKFYQKLCSHLPTSYQYPIIGISHKLLPMPNHLGRDLALHGRLFHKQANEAHIRFSRREQMSGKPTEGELFDLMQILNGCQRRSSKTTDAHRGTSKDQTRTLPKPQIKVSCPLHKAAANHSHYESRKTVSPGQQSWSSATCGSHGSALSGNQQFYQGSRANLNQRRGYPTSGQHRTYHRTPGQSSAVTNWRSDQSTQNEDVTPKSGQPGDDKRARKWRK